MALQTVFPYAVKEVHHYLHPKNCTNMSGVALGAPMRSPVAEIENLQVSSARA